MCEKCREKFTAMDKDRKPTNVFIVHPDGSQVSFKLGECVIIGRKHSSNEHIAFAEATPEFLIEQASTLIQRLVRSSLQKELGMSDDAVREAEEMAASIGKLLGLDFSDVFTEQKGMFNTSVKH